MGQTNRLLQGQTVHGDGHARVRISAAQRSTKTRGGRVKLRAKHRRFGLAPSRSLTGELTRWWREQRCGDGGGAVFAPRCPTTRLRRGMRVSWRPHGGRVDPPSRWGCRARRSPHARMVYVNLLRSVDFSVKAIDAAIDAPDLMLRSGHGSG